MTAPTYTVHKLPGLAFAVTDQNGKTWCVCDRQEDAERIAGVMNSHDDMLAALNAMLPESNSGRPTFETCEQARAAIARATGAQ